MSLNCKHEFEPVEFEKTPDNGIEGIWKICKHCNLVQLETVKFEEAEA